MVSCRVRSIRGGRKGGREEWEGGMNEESGRMSLEFSAQCQDKVMRTKKRGRKREKEEKEKKEGQKRKGRVSSRREAMGRRWDEWVPLRAVVLVYGLPNLAAQ